jgi:hypothetical protein
VADVSSPAAFIIYWDPMLDRIAFAGPYEEDERLKTDMRRLEDAGCLDVAMVLNPDIANWMPSLRFDIPHPATDVYRSGGAVRVTLGWDAVERAFPGQFVEASSLDGERFHGRVTAVDIAARQVWAEVS